MFAQERHNAIKKIVRAKRRLGFADLQALIKVSPATLRRDLADLEKSGEIIRVHGGVLDPGYMRSEISFHEKLLRNSPAKKAIAAKVASLIPSGASVYVDAGSTCLEAGKVLLGRKEIRVITHSAALTAAALPGQAEFLCIGGELRRVSGALTGSRALGALSVIRADFALLGASGMNLEGCSTTETSEAEMKRTIMERCQRNILLADSSKWPEPSTINFAGWTDFDDWVTDKNIPAKDGKTLRSLGLAIHLAS